jgi:hypothetical protein
MLQAWNARISDWISSLALNVENEHVIEGILEVNERVTTLQKVYTYLQAAGIGTEHAVMEDIHTAFKMLTGSDALAFEQTQPDAEERFRLNEQLSCLQVSWHSLRSCVPGSVLTDYDEPAQRFANAQVHLARDHARWRP